jgi:hypothetical protein
MTNPIVAAARASALGRAREAREDQIERTPDGRLLFASKTSFNGAGTRFTVYDVVQGAGRFRKVAHGSLGSSHRVFVMADGSRWVCAFVPGEERALDAVVLERQIDAGTYVAGDIKRANPR